MRKISAFLVCILLAASQLLAQNRTVTGRVTDEKGAAIPNASVTVKGTNLGTTTGDDGTFSLKVAATAKTLVISSVNFNSVEIAIGRQTNVSVTLQSSSNSLDEVVVVGYGTQQKKAFTG